MLELDEDLLELGDDLFDGDEGVVALDGGLLGLKQFENGVDDFGLLIGD